MKYNSPKLTLTLKNGATYEISDSYLIKDSISISSTLMKDLRPSSSRCSLRVGRDYQNIEQIIGYNDTIRATLKDGDTYVFTGYLSSKFNYRVTEHGTQVIDFTIEDIGTRALEVMFAPSNGNGKLVNGKSNTIISSILTTAGITEATNSVKPSIDIVKNIEAGTTCKKALDDIMFECGYVYTFNEMGQFVSKSISTTSAPVKTIDKANLYSNGSDAINVSKSAIQYKQSRITYETLATKNNTLVYQDISGRDDGHPYANIEVQGGYAYPSQLTVDDHTTEELTSYTDANDLDQGFKLYYIDNVQGSMTWTGGSNISYDIKKSAPTQLSVLVKNEGASATRITRLEAKADVCYVKSTDVVVSGDTDVDEKIFEYECSYVHDKTNASRLANLISQYYTNSNIGYSFYTDEDIELGSIIQLTDNVHSGLTATIIVTSKSITRDNVFTYSGVSLTPFDLSADVEFNSNLSSSTNIPGLSVSEDNVWVGTDDPQGDNYVVWVDPDGIVTDLKGDDGKLFLIQSSSPTMVKNLRVEEKTNEIIIMVAIQGYEGVTPRLLFGEEDVTDDIIWDAEHVYGNYVYSYSTWYATECSFSWFYDENLNRGISLGIDDQTGSWKYLGEFSSDPIDSNKTITGGKLQGSQVVEGDTYLNVTEENNVVTSIPMVYSNNKFQRLSNLQNIDGYDEKIILMLDKVFDYSDDSSLNHVTTTDYDFFKNIVAKHITAEYIGGQKIKVMDNGVIYGGGYDVGGNLINATANGFWISSDGTFKTNGAVFDELTIKSGSTFEGTITSDVINTNLNASTVGATYEAHSANFNPSGALWSQIYSNMKSWLDSKVVNGTIYSCSGSVNGFSPSGVIKISSKMGDTTLHDSSFKSDGAKDLFTLSSSPVARRVTVTGKTAIDWNFVYDWNMPQITVTIGNNSYVLSARKSGSDFWKGSWTGWDPSQERKNFSNTYDIPAGATFKISIGGESYTLNDSSGSLKVVENRGIYNVGYNFYKSGETTSYSIDSAIPSSGVCTSCPSLSVTNLGRVINFDIANKNNYPSGINPLYTFKWDTGKAPTKTGTASIFYGTPTFTVVNSSGTTLGGNVKFLNWTTTSVKSNGDVELSTSTYVRSYSVVFSLEDSPKGVYLGNTYPHKDYSLPTIGTTDNPFGNICGNLIQSSARKQKENIEDFTDNATEIIDGVDVVSFNYKADSSKEWHCGFIADDTDWRLSSIHHDRFETQNCIGLLLKAVQELNARIKELESK